MQEAISAGLVNSMSKKDQWEEADELFLLFEEKGCSALKPYKVSQLTQLTYVEEFADYPISEANDLFKQFPAIEIITVQVETQKIPENLFHGLPHLKEVFIFGIIETLPIHLFEQNSNLEELNINSDEFIGFTDSQFFRYIPNLEELRVTMSSSPSDVPPVKLPEDFCDVVPSLVSFSRRRSVSKAPRSCHDINYNWFEYL